MTIFLYTLPSSAKDARRRTPAVLSIRSSEDGRSARSPRSKVAPPPRRALVGFGGRGQDRRTATAPAAAAGVNPVFDYPDRRRLVQPGSVLQHLVAPEFGTARAINLRGPRQVNIDFSTMKDFPASARPSSSAWRCSTRAEYHVELGTPNTGWGSSNKSAACFGLLRILPKPTLLPYFFALKYNFWMNDHIAWRLLVAIAVAASLVAQHPPPQETPGDRRREGLPP